MKRHLQCAGQQASPSNLTKCCPCHEKWCASLIVVTYATSFTMRGATSITLQPHQMLRLPRKIAFQNQRKMRRKQLKRQFQCGDDPSMIRAWARHLAPARSASLLFALRRRILYWKLQHFALRLSIQTSPNTAPATKSDTPRSPNTAPATKSDTRTSPNAAPATKSDTPTSPNAAPATKNDAHHWLSWHMQRHLQCAEQQASPSNLTKCCACHAKLHSKIKEKFAENSWSVNSNAGTIRAWSEHEVVISRPPVRRAYFSRFGDAFCIENYNISRSGYLSKLHQILRLPRKVTLRHHQILRLPRKVMRGRSEHDPSMKSSSRTRPFGELTFRASETHFVLKITTFRAPAIYPNFTKYCACHEKWHSDITKYCACHEKWDCHWTVTELSCYEAVPELLLSCYWTELLLNWPVTGLSLNCYWTDLLLTCYWTELLLNCYWTVSGLSLNCYWTNLLLSSYWPVTELSCYWTVTELNCYWTDLLLDCHWTVTELTCYWAVTELYWTLCIFKSP